MKKVFYIKNKLENNKDKSFKEEQLKILEIAKKCNCGCHHFDLMHCIPCCDATYLLISDLEKNVA